jgi:hypothetical protein
MTVKHTNKEVVSMKCIILLSIIFWSLSIQQVAAESGLTDIIQLIEKAKRKYPKEVRGTFQIPIKATGSQGGVIFLNSNLDYRDPKSIAVALLPSTIEPFTNMYGASPDLYFLNKTIEVVGKVKRVKIYMYKNGKRTKKYYFQTHIKVTNIEQVKILD